MHQGHLVVVLSSPDANRRYTSPIPSMPNGSKLGRPECAQAGGPIDAHAPVESEQDLLVPDRQRLTERSVNQGEHVRSVRLDGAEHVGLAGGR